MPSTDTEFELRLARTETDLKAAQRLRYRVFVEELGSTGPMVDHVARLEIDQFDPFYDHLLLIDTALPQDGLDHVVGVYRLLRSDQLNKVGRFYTEDEYDLSVLKSSGRRLLELGRSCVAPDYRGGAAMFHLWNGLADYVFEHDIEILFGVASFHGTDVQALKLPLSYLHHAFLAPGDLRVRAVPDRYQSMDLLPADQVDRKAAVMEIPSLIKGYLRLGGFVGDGAFVDQAFNTTDVCLVIDINRMNAAQRAAFEKGRQR